MGEFLVRILVEGEEAIVEEFLLPRIDYSMILFNNIQTRGLSYRGQRYEGIYAGAFDGPEMVGLVAHYWNNNLIFQAPTHLDALIKTALKASGRPVGGLLGPEEQVQLAKDILGLSTVDLRYDEVEKLYSLNLDDLIVPGILSTGQVRGRLANQRDIDLLVNWRIAYLEETLNEQETPDLVNSNAQAIRGYIAEGRTWVIENSDGIVATSSLNASVYNSAGTGTVQVGGVWTPPSMRRQGYGRAVVATSLVDVRENNIGKAILFTNESNIAAQKAYTALGFRHIGAYHLTFLREPTTP